MALSGSFTGTTANDKIIPTIIWSATQSVSGNYSDVVAELRYSRTDNLDSYGYWTGSITINGTKIPLTTYEEEIGESVDNSRHITITKNSNTLAMKTPAVRVPHNSDGSKSITISAAGKISGTTLSSTTISKTITLDTIPRKATITAAPDFNDEQNPTITYNNSAGTVVDTLQACISLDGDIDIAYRDISKTGSSYTFNLTTAERNVLRNGTTTANSREIKFYIKTVIGENTYYSSLAKTLTIINANPTINPTIKDTGTASTVLTGDGNNKLIKEHNFMSITIGAAALKGATIKSQKVECGSQSFTTATGSLTNVSSGSFKFTVVDSRGNTTTKTVNKTMIDYVKLTCNLSASAPTTDGVLSFSVNGNYFNGSFGAVSNTLTVQYRLKTNDGAYTDWAALTPTITNNTYKVSSSISGLDYRSTYTIQARAIDKIYANTLSAEKKLKTTPVFDWGENDFNFNVPVVFNAGSKMYNNTLWSGAVYMNASQTITLPKAISEQNSGIVLVFSNYDTSTGTGIANDYDWHSYFVPKGLVAAKEDTGHCFNMMSQSFGDIASKYIYISDTQLRGHDNNTTSGTRNGITYNNAKYVLRFIYGV